MENDTEGVIPTLHSKRNITLEKQVAIYRLLFFTLGLFAIIELIFVIVLYKSQTISIPYVVEINKEGDIKYKDNITSTLAKWQPSTATKIKVLSDFLTDLRSVSLDKQIQIERIKRIYAFSIENGLKESEKYLLETKPLERLNNQRVEINVYATTPLINNDENVFQLDFNEKIYSLSGNLISEQNYRAILETKHFLPKTEQTQIINPLGIYISNLKISAIKDGYVLL